MHSWCILWYKNILNLKQKQKINWINDENTVVICVKCRHMCTESTVLLWLNVILTLKIKWINYQFITTTKYFMVKVSTTTKK